jgi:hypothetical protein
MQNGRIGIELMTAWAGGGESTEFLGERLRVLLDEADTSTDKIVALSNALAGVAAVAGDLLVLLAGLAHRTEEEVLQKIAKNYQPHD